jgi:hypothetical protein
MAHFIDTYADRTLEILRYYMAEDFFFFKQEIIEVSDLLTAFLVSYDLVTDDVREIHKDISPSDFLERMSKVKADWKVFDLEIMRGMEPHQTIIGWEGRTIYILKQGQRPEYWTPEKASEDITNLLMASAGTVGQTIQFEVEKLDEFVPVGHEHFSQYEHIVRVVFNFLFRGELGDGRAQARTEPENEGLEIRDLLFSNRANQGFWKDLKDKYEVSEVVVDAKNKDVLERDELRQLYCYLKPALGFWGFVVCRSPQPEPIHAFNRTLYKNFVQKRGLMILTDEDLRRMVLMKNASQAPSFYLQKKMSEFLQSI